MPTTHVEGMYSKEIYVGAGQGLYEKPLYLPSIFSVVVGLQYEVCFQEDILHWVFVEEMKARLPRLRASEEPQALKDSEQKIWVWGCPNKKNK